MAWVRIEAGMPEHQKVAGLSDGAFRAYIESVCYAARALTDGFIPEPVAKKSRWSKHAGALVGASLWEMAGGGWLIHDYLDFNPSREQVEKEREAARERMANARANKGRSSGNVPANFARSSDNPSPPLPIPSPEEENTQIAREPVSLMEFREAPGLYANLATAGIQRPPERWAESWLERGRSAEHIRDAIGRMRECANTPSTRYVDRILEGEPEDDWQAARAAGAGGVRRAAANGGTSGWRGRAGSRSAGGGAPVGAVAGFDPTGYRVIGAD